jgi:hypothetical protein
MPQFSPDQVTFRDNIGYGNWDDNHHREHLQFVQVLSTRTPAINLPVFDLLQMLSSEPTRATNLNNHNQSHALLRQITGVSGVDYTEFNLDDENDFYSFTGYHSTEHQAIRTALGMT